MDPQARPTAKQALESPWMRQNLSADSTKLDTAKQGLRRRATIKLNRESQNQNLERVSVGKLLEELTRFGLDFNSEMPDFNSFTT